MSGAAIVVRGNALRLPLPDASVDLITTSPPYFALRSYRDGDEHYEGQIGSEPTPQEFLAALWACTREWWRVLKPSGSLFVNLGDKYGGGGYPASGVRDKSLLGLPWRYAIGCIDGEADPEGIGWVLRAEVVWSKPNDLPESVTDRVRRSHEQWFHFTKSERYYSAADEIREPSEIVFDAPQNGTAKHARAMSAAEGFHRYDERTNNPLGKLPGSVWSIPSEPLIVPDYLGLPDHYAAFPQEWPRRLILGWSPHAICEACGEGRRPVTDVALEEDHRSNRSASGRQDNRKGAEIATGSHGVGADKLIARQQATIQGYSCRCTPYTDHPARRDGVGGTTTWSKGGLGTSGNVLDDTGRYAPREGVAWRDYHLANWNPPPSRPAVVLDPFGGTGTTAGVARTLGRVGVSVDLSYDYCRLARWRIFRSGHFTKTEARTWRERQTSLF